MFEYYLWLKLHSIDWMPICCFIVSSSEKPYSHKQADGEECFVRALSLSSLSSLQVLHRKLYDNIPSRIVINARSATMSCFCIESKERRTARLAKRLIHQSLKSFTFSTPGFRNLSVFGVSGIFTSLDNLGFYDEMPQTDLR